MLYIVYYTCVRLTGEHESFYTYIGSFVIVPIKILNLPPLLQSQHQRDVSSYHWRLPTFNKQTGMSHYTVQFPAKRRLRLVLTVVTTSD